MVTPRVAWIHTAPIKALAIEERQRVTLTERGIPGDRDFVIVDEDARMINGKRIPKLVAIRPEFDDEARRLTLRMPDGARVSGDNVLGAPYGITIFGRAVAARMVDGKGMCKG